MRAGYGKNMRHYLVTRATPKLIIDFGELPVFEAGTDPAIILVEKANIENSYFTTTTIKTPEEIEKVEEIVGERGFSLPVSMLKADGWTLEQPEILTLIKKLQAISTPLREYVKGRFYYGIKTGLNEAFVIDAATRDKLISEDPASVELIKPWLRGRDIRKWRAQWAGLYLINIPSSANRQWPWSDAKTEAVALRLFEQTYPAIHRHLSQWKKQLKERDDQGKFWWELRSCAYYNAFEQPKIIYPDIAKLMRACYDNAGTFCANTLYILPTYDLSIIGLIHSKLFDWYCRYKFQALGDPWKGGRLRFIAEFMGEFPIPPATDAQKSPIIERTHSILADPDSPAVPRLESEINTLIYNLYDLTKEEIAIVDQRVGNI